MKTTATVVVLALAALALYALAQERLEDKPIEITGIEAGATRDTREIVDVLYRSPRIRDQCLKTPEARLDVALNGYKVPLDCSLWVIWYKRALELAEQP